MYVHSRANKHFTPTSHRCCQERCSHNTLPHVIHRAKNLKGAEVATDLMTGSSPGGLMSRQPLGIKALAHGMATSQDSNITGVQITEEVRHVMCK